jgi:hypothetical protein
VGVISINSAVDIRTHATTAGLTAIEVPLLIERLPSFLANKHLNYAYASIFQTKLNNHLNRIENIKSHVQQKKLLQA